MSLSIAATAPSAIPPSAVAPKQAGTAAPAASAPATTSSATSATATAAAKPAAQPKVSVSSDTVTLSLSAQVIQLSQQGQQPPQIALILGIPVSAVNSDLGIST